MKTLTVQSYRGPYEAHFVEDAAATLQAELTPGDRLIVDQNVAKLYAETLGPIIEQHEHRIIEACEPAKSYQQIEDVIRWLIESSFKRSGRIVAIGGGIIQDISAFSASVLYRGVDWMFVPTNLLSQCDSCIGSKTSVNFGTYKNMLGGFHPARQVFIDLKFLDTLPEREIRSGLGEMMHYFLYAGREDFERVRDSFDAALTDRGVLRELIHRSLEIKKEMIERDEFDKGPRNVFNYGHTFGHALESYTNYAVPHGIAVSYGMDLANRLSWKLGYITEAEFEEMRALLRKNWVGLPVENFDLERYLDLLRKDKKNVDQNVRVILSRGIGDIFVEKRPLDDMFRENVTSCIATYLENN